MRSGSILVLSLLLVCGGCGPNGSANGNDNNGTQHNQNDNLILDNDNGIDRDDGNDNIGSESVVVVPRSVGGGVTEASAFTIERDVTQLGEQFPRLQAVAAAVTSVERVRQRFRRALDIARRIEASPLTELSNEVRTADIELVTPLGETICVRISNEPFIAEEGGDLQGGALLDADLGATEDAIALRVWVNRLCNSVDEDYRRFYASLVEVRPDDVELEEVDDSSANAWRAGRGRAWIRPGALLGFDTSYRAKCFWDHTDSTLRRTYFAERGRINAFAVLEFGRYMVEREEITDDTGQTQICKRVQAVMDFEEHPVVDVADIRFGFCRSADDEALVLDQLYVQGTVTLVNGEVIEINPGCIGTAGDEMVDCGMSINGTALGLAEIDLSSKLPDLQNVDLPETSYEDTPPSADETTIIDLGMVEVE
ncbi:MAG: hypothetical protein HJJLKODD_00179 [Phycisphaerae bacterium]|nr:hypothetical protein [Phycisphaerae bacterium]